MTTPETHTQVRLKLNEAYQIAWIPSYAAHEGYEVELKEDGLFWTVAAVFSTMESSVVKENERLYKSHRKGTDI